MGGGGVRIYRCVDDSGCELRRSRVTGSSKVFGMKCVLGGGGGGGWNEV